MDTNRKSMNLCFNFAELGTAALNHDRVWMVPLTLRTKILAEIPGGWSHVLRRYLHLQLFGPEGLATSGVPLMLHGSPYLLKAEWKAMISDGDGLRAAFQWRGAGALLPCFRHCNVLKAGSGLAERGNGFVEIDCADVDKFKLWPRSELHSNVDQCLQASRLRRSGKITKEDNTMIHMSVGLSVTEFGLLADRALRENINFIDVMRYDWAHSCCQAGVVTHALSHFVDNLKKKRYPLRSLARILGRNMVFPQSNQEQNERA